MWLEENKVFVEWRSLSRWKMTHDKFKLFKNEDLRFSFYSHLHRLSAFDSFDCKTIQRNIYHLSNNMQNHVNWILKLHNVVLEKKFTLKFIEVIKQTQKYLLFKMSSPKTSQCPVPTR